MTMTMTFSFSHYGLMTVDGSLYPHKGRPQFHFGPRLPLSVHPARLFLIMRR